MDIASPRGQEMATYLPPLYESSVVMAELLEAEGADLDLLRAAIEELHAQLFVTTATWGLDAWDTFLGLTPATGFTDGERRDRLVARMRGWGSANKDLIKSIASSYTYGTVTVQDQNDGEAAYVVVVQLIDALGIPSTFNEFSAALRAAIPAHLGVTFIFNFMTWDDLDAANWTWNQIDGTDPGGPLGAPLTWDEWEEAL